MNVKIYESEQYDFSKEKKQKRFGVLHDTFSNNELLVDTSGFVPLTVRIKQMMLSGALHALNSSAFDSADFEEMYSDLHQNTIEIGDDFEDLNAKAALIAERRQEILERKGFVNSADDEPMKGNEEAEEEKPSVKKEKSSDE